METLARADVQVYLKLITIREKRQFLVAGDTLQVLSNPIKLQATELI